MPLSVDKLLTAIGAMASQVVEDAAKHRTLWDQGIADSAWWCRQHMLDQVELIKELVEQLPEPPEPP